jgi:hypothetical protein
MGWWKIENDDLLGDLPADEMNSALKELKAAAQPTDKLSLKELVGAIIVIIHDHESELLETGHAPLSGSIALYGQPLISVNEAVTDYNKTIVEKLRAPLQAISNTYNDACSRRPRFSEIIATLIFSLSAESSDFIEEIKDKKLQAGDLSIKSDPS